MWSRTGLALLVALAASGLVRGTPQEGWRLDLATPRPRDDDVPASLDGLERLSCAACHEEIAAEWAATMHAFAWEDPRYRAELVGKRRPESCHGCHVPEPLHQVDAVGRKPPAREGNRHFGVACQSCHLGPDGTVLGPWGHPNDAHRSVRSEHFVGPGSNELCATCHATTIGPVIGVAKDFRARRLGERGMSCVGCHMAPVERSMAVDDDDRPTPVRAGRSHRLQTPRDPAFLARAFRITAHRGSGETLVRVENRAGHRVPGLVGRTIRIRAHGIDAAGEPSGRDEIVIDASAYLAVEGSLELRLAGEAERVRIEGEHLAPSSRAPVAFLELDLAPVEKDR